MGKFLRVVEFRPGDNPVAALGSRSSVESLVVRFMKTYTLKSTKRRQGEVKFEIRNSKYETNSEDEKSKLETVKPALDFVLCPISDLFRSYRGESFANLSIAGGNR